MTIVLNSNTRLSSSIASLNPTPYTGQTAFLYVNVFFLRLLRAHTEREGSSFPPPPHTRSPPTPPLTISTRLRRRSSSLMNEGPSLLARRAALPLPPHSYLSSLPPHLPHPATVRATSQPRPAPRQRRFLAHAHARRVRDAY